MSKLTLTKAEAAAIVALGKAASDVTIKDAEPVTHRIETLERAIFFVADERVRLRNALVAAALVLERLKGK